MATTVHTRAVKTNNNKYSIHATRWLLSGDPFDIEVARTDDHHSSLTIEQDGKSIALVMNPAQLEEILFAINTHVGYDNEEAAQEPR